MDVQEAIQAAMDEVDRMEANKVTAVVEVTVTVVVEEVIDDQRDVFTTLGVGSN